METSVERRADKRPPVWRMEPEAKRARGDADGAAGVSAAAPDGEDELAVLRSRCAAQEAELDEMREQQLHWRWREGLWRGIVARAPSTLKQVRMAPYAHMASEVNCMAVAHDGSQFICTESALWLRPAGAKEATLIAGKEKAMGFADGVGTRALFRDPNGIALHADGTIFVADTQNHAIRVVRRVGQVWAVTTLAGNGEPGYSDGVAMGAQFHEPWGIVVDPQGGWVFVTDSDNHVLRRVHSTTGEVTTLAGTRLGAAIPYGHADGPGTSALFHSPSGLALYAPGCLCVSDSENDCIRVVVLDQGTHCHVATIDTTGRELPRSWAWCSDRPQPFITTPQGITVDGEKNIIVASGKTIKLIRLRGDPFQGKGKGKAAGTEGGSSAGAAEALTELLPVETETTLLTLGKAPCALALDERGRILVAAANNRGQMHRVCTDLPWAWARVLYIGALKGGDVASSGTGGAVHGDGACAGGGGRGGGGMKTRCLLSMLPQAGRAGCPILARIIRMVRFALASRAHAVFLEDAVVCVCVCARARTSMFVRVHACAHAHRHTSYLTAQRAS